MNKKATEYNFDPPPHAKIRKLIPKNHTRQEWNAGWNGKHMS
jgi:hypothetical protein